MLTGHPSTALLKDENICSAAVIPYITAIVNHSLQSAIIPSDFKVAQVTPRIKKNNINVADFKNYRPISNRSFISNILERVVSKQITGYLSQSGLRDAFQSTYKPGHSTEAALLMIKSDMDLILDQGDGVLVVLLDF